MIGSDKKVKYIFRNPYPNTIDFEEAIRAIQELRRRDNRYIGPLIETLKGYILACSENEQEEMIVLDMEN